MFVHDSIKSIERSELMGDLRISSRRLIELIWPRISIISVMSMHSRRDLTQSNSSIVMPFN